jgi:hypothetical protein
MVQWSPGRRVVVLGAGATRGAEFVVDPSDEAPPLACQPPLNADFFTQLQRITSDRHQDVVDGVIEDILEIYGPNFTLTLEQYFTQLEAMLSMVRDAIVAAPNLGPDDLVEKRTRLLNAVAAVMEESADVAKAESPARQHPCSYHAQLVDVLRPRDTIISFNYDCVIDFALRSGGGRRWSAKHGYGFPRPNRVEGFEGWSGENAVHGVNSTINLLKLHGSLNWFPFPAAASGTIKLRQKPYKQRGEKLYEIIPPEYAKSIGVKPIFRSLWTRAELALRRATTMAFIGFSFTPTDLHVEALFRLALAANRKLERVVVVNPSEGHRRRIRSILSRPLAAGVGLIQFDTFRDFAPHTTELLT